MAGVTFTAAEIETARAAILQNPGVKKMQIADRVYEFQTLQERMDFLDYLERHLDTRVSSTVTRYASTSKGLRDSSWSSGRGWRW